SRAPGDDARGLLGKVGIEIPHRWFGLSPAPASIRISISLAVMRYAHTACPLPSRLLGATRPPPSYRLLDDESRDDNSDIVPADSPRFLVALTILPVDTNGYIPSQSGGEAGGKCHNNGSPADRKSVV